MLDNTNGEDFTYLIFDCELMVELNKYKYDHSQLKWNGLLHGHNL